MERITTLLLIITLGLNIYSQTTYTVSNTDGGADYTYPTGLQTAINSGTFDGGANINFNRGEIFDGSITITNHDGVSGTPIKFGAYGTGADPIITTIDTVTDTWSDAGGGNWQVTLSRAPTEILYLWADGVKQTLGRLPNTGYYDLNTSGATTTSLPDDDLTEVDDYWNGYEVVCHTADWALEKSIVTDFDAATNTMTISPAFDYGPGGFYSNTDMGYFFQNHIGCLDVSGEWAYNLSTNVLTYRGNPSGVSFTYAHTGDLFTLSGSDYITFENIQFEKADGIGINSSNSDYTTVDNCSFYFLDAAYYSTLSDYDTVKNSYIEDVASNGVGFFRNYYGGIDSNEFNRIAIIPGEGDDEVEGADLKAIHIGAIYQNNRWEGCDSVTVSRNRIDSVGHSGIHFEISNNTIIKNNWITEPVQLKFDAGGIYAWHNADSVHISGETNYVLDYDSSWVLNNYVSLDYFNLDKSWTSTRTGTDTIAQVFGLYWDDGNMGINTKNNLVTGFNFNIFIHNTGHSVYENNITYKARLYELYSRNNLDANKDTMTDSRFDGNQYVSYYDGSEELYKYEHYFLYVENTDNNTWSNNYYMYPFGHRFGTDYITYTYTAAGGGAERDIASWRTWSSATADSIHPFSYSDTDLSTRDSLVYIIYNFSESPISTNSYFNNGYGYFKADSSRVQEETIEAYDSRIYLVDRGAYVYDEEPEEPEEPTTPAIVTSGAIVTLGGETLIFYK